MGALSHLRVLDLSRVLAGPWASQILADLGADVVKVERPGSGDDTRSWGPPFLKDAAGQATPESAYFLSANRNKRSITIDFTQPRGQELVRELAIQSDVLIENFKVDGLAQYGLDYASLARLKPALIYCSITGFGQTGPYRTRPGYDLLIQAMGGLMSITGRGESEVGAGPQKVGVALVDILTGLYAATSVLAALAARERDGQGQHIDLALLDVEIACLANQAMNFLVSGEPPRRLGNAHPSIVPYQDFPTLDGEIILAVGNDGQFADFCEVAGHPEWGVDARFATNRERVRHRDELVPLLRRCLIERRTFEWVDLLERAGVPCGPVNSIDAVFRDPQVQSRQLRFDLPRAGGTAVPMVQSPIRMSGTPVTHRLAPPMLGQHTGEVLAERLHLGIDEIAALRAAGVI